MQKVVVSQIEACQVHSSKHTEREAPQQVGVEEQQLEGRHGVESPTVYLADLIVLKVKVPKGEERPVLQCLCIHANKLIRSYGNRGVNGVWLC